MNPFWKTEKKPPEKGSIRKRQLQKQNLPPQALEARMMQAGDNCSRLGLQTPREDRLKIPYIV